MKWNKSAKESDMPSRRNPKMSPAASDGPGGLSDSDKDVLDRHFGEMHQILSPGWASTISLERTPPTQVVDQDPR